MSDKPDFDEIAFNLTPIWDKAVKSQFGASVYVDFWAAEDVSEYHGDADIVVTLWDREFMQNDGFRHPSQKAVDFVMKGVQAQNKNVTFALDPLVHARP